MNQSLAYIHPDAKIGKNVTIGPFTNIEAGVEIGDGTWISSNVTIMSGARIGKNCRIFPGAVISAIPQDLKFEGEETLAVIGDNTTIREGVTINRGTKASGETRVGNNCLIMATAHVAHDCVLGNNCIVANAVALAGHVEVGDYAILGGLSAVHQFVHIGKHTIISGGSLVRKDIPPYTKAGKDPVSFIGINSTGLKRRGFSQDKINEIQNIYRIIFQKNYNNNQALMVVETELQASEERDEIIAFIKQSPRGIMKGFTSIRH
ncbi:MAG: acyl-[acyl-carrier-protein]--UDP-N-acetylglucosamine O-acyltransferase [Flavobacteriia bacterium]|nr:MAG: acyl-[acyl-carrier-protein]--UDP-N-acetylglucosamine O-acyltransferase [Flavobacteriia bacterium]